MEEQRLTAVGKVFWVALCWFPNFREFIEVELGQTEPRGAHKASGSAYPWACLIISSFSFWSLPEAFRVSLVQKKIVKSFAGLVLRLVLISWKTKNRQKQQLALRTK